MKTIGECLIPEKFNKIKLLRAQMEYDLPFSQLSELRTINFLRFREIWPLLSNEHGFSVVLPLARGVRLPEGWGVALIEKLRFMVANPDKGTVEVTVAEAWGLLLGWLSLWMVVEVEVSLSQRMFREYGVERRSCLAMIPSVVDAIVEAIDPARVPVISPLIKWLQ